ncbi:MAG: hypothetical protein Aurels2KO_11120 [Aureliella sp.]
MYYAHFTSRLLAIGALLALAPTCKAALVAGTLSFDARADQRIRVPDGSPLTGAPFNIPANAEFDLSALGSISLGWEADGDSNGSVALTSFSASFLGADPTLGPYSLAGAGDGPGATFNGTLDNIVESGGELVSADWTLNTTFSFRFTGAPGQPLVYTRDLATFTGVVRGGNATLGEVFTSNGDVNGFLSLGGDPSNDPVAAISFNRTVTAVPEPGSVALLCCFGSIGILRRRRS